MVGNVLKQTTLQIGKCWSHWKWRAEPSPCLLSTMKTQLSFKTIAYGCLWPCHPKLLKSLPNVPTPTTGANIFIKRDQNWGTIEKSLKKINNPQNPEKKIENLKKLPGCTKGCFLEFIKHFRGRLRSKHGKRKLGHLNLEKNLQNPRKPKEKKNNDPPPKKTLKKLEKKPQPTPQKKKKKKRFQPGTKALRRICHAGQDGRTPAHQRLG